jgi:hypothetical protein
MRWLYVAAIGISLAGSVQAQTVGHRSSNSSATQSQAKPQTDASPAISVAVQNNIQRIAGALESANKKPPSETDERNAKAQERVANWTPWLFGVALLEAIITAGGVYLVYRTLFATRQAVRHAERAADAAERALTASRISSEKQLRAYIRFALDMSNPGVFAPNVRLIVNANNENCGLTPAVRVRSAGEVNILPWPPPDPFPEPFDDDGAVFTLYPNLRFPWITPIYSQRAFTQAEIAEAVDGKTKRLYLFGWIKYFDVFGKEHFTKFRMMSGVEPKTNLFSFCSDGNETDDD